MQTVTSLKAYKANVDKALRNRFQRQALDNFAVAYPTGRANAFAGMNIAELVDKVADIKDRTLSRMDELYAQFKANAEKKGIHVHLAATALEANAIIADIAKTGRATRIVKSKSMTAEETLLNHYLESEGLEVTETDLGEWIIQLRHEGPTHMVMPAIHLSRHQVADLFSEVTGKRQETEIERLVKVARRELRQKYVEADMGISGANFALSDTATIGLTTNEGNARLVTTLPRIHVALVGLDKLLPSLEDALHINRVLPRNATGQQITSYVTWITGPTPCAAADSGRKEMHIVFLDNGRRALAKDPVFSQVLRCVRCGACANVCPVYRMVGGHQYGHIYIGAIGLIVTYFFHGRDKAKNLVQNCINCGACKAVCAAGIDLPRLIKEIHARIQDETDHPLSSILLGKLLSHRKLFHQLLRTAQKAQAPVVGENGYLRHLPLILSKEHNFRALPPIAKTPFRERWPEIKPSVANPTQRVALFAGCVQDFVYPEQLEAGVALMARFGAAVEFPMQQSCCGLPALMMGEKAAARDVARRNILAMRGSEVDQIVTLCASCASHLKHNYPQLLADDPAMREAAERFSEKVVAFSSFMNDILEIPADAFRSSGTQTTYHAPCHLCRCMGVKHAPHELIRKAGLAFVPAREEETCCGFGGSYSGKFPQISAQILESKLADVAATGADLLVTECPGCVMQLRGGAEKKGMKLSVKHIAEAMVQALEKT
ncbi:(Fe-S)-binding protein [Desulfosarcina ovata subsp. sediminis]|uniref:(Fe-S)-binding protein n=1 Tax=Desulfosarcina ovata subsp. sediminis TaxID=885957 RepID=A0A5K7ZKZ3_9BACT|nr:LUD domain-containing protein [Desulfosarcina ovata]BBO81581.1 (Fe-S)-binding protein [Desulfosarcina ovata subsp. sediminis]